MTARNRPRGEGTVRFSGPVSVAGERLRDALTAAAGTAVEVRPLTVPARRRIRFPGLLTTAVAAAAVVAAAFTVTVAVRSASGPLAPGLSKEHVITMAMTGASPGRADRADVSVFLCMEDDYYPHCGGREATAAQKEEIRRRLDALPEAELVVFESRREAYASFRAEFADRAALLEAIQVEDLPESFRVKTRNSADSQVVMEAVQGLPGVSNVVDLPCLLKERKC
ncbi:permease-like cell division protein FtsX [Planomonospora corallina]|uniref:Permease-like cell division protein FtsX n=1 Tax=Planomonospora corallina TaxID=1806052 RepID=A0ABV8I1X4_9ACTN